MIEYKPYRVECLVEEEYEKKFDENNPTFGMIIGYPTSYTYIPSETIYIQLASDLPDNVYHGAVHETIHLAIGEIMGVEISHQYDRICYDFEEGRKEWGDKLIENGNYGRRPFL